ncbi:MAG: SDR family oxidoreductase [Gemmatimonadota bacterium]
MLGEGNGRVALVTRVGSPAGIGFATLRTLGREGVVAAKAGMDGLMRGLAIEVASRGVTVNGVQPHFVATKSQTSEGEDHGRQTPIGRSGTPEEVGEVVAFLASERASYVTGQPLVVDDGNVIQEAKGP